MDQFRRFMECIQNLHYWHFTLLEVSEILICAFQFSFTLLIQTLTCRYMHSMFIEIYLPYLFCNIDFIFRFKINFRLILDNLWIYFQLNVAILWSKTILITLISQHSNSFLNKMANLKDELWKTTKSMCKFTSLYS